MSAEEVERYICNMALSGALEFIEKYESESGGDGSGIIGHFGLGFYSAFMVADTVDVLTKTYKADPAAAFSATEEGSYELSLGEREGRGTDVVLHINDDAKEFLEVTRLREILDRYCAFMPVEIYLVDAEATIESEEEKEEFLCDAAARIQKSKWMLTVIFPLLFTFLIDSFQLFILERVF